LLAGAEEAGQKVAACHDTQLRTFVSLVHHRKQKPSSGATHKGEVLQPAATLPLLPHNDLKFNCNIADQFTLQSLKRETEPAVNGLQNEVSQK